MCQAIATTLSSPAPSAPSGMSHSIASYIGYDNFSTQHCAFLAASVAHHEPEHFSQAVTDPNWHHTMAQEISTLEVNDT